MAGKGKFDIKKFLISHGEKVALGVVVAIALYALATASWVPFNGNPADVTAKITSGTERFVNRTVTPEDEKLWVISAKERPSNVIRQELLADVDPQVRQFWVKFAPSFRDRRIPLREPKFIELKNLQVEIGRRLFHLGVASPEADVLASSGTTPAGTEKPEEKPATPAPPDLVGIRRGDDQEFGRPVGAGTGTDPLTGMPIDTLDSPSMAPELQMISTYGTDGLNEASLELKGQGRYFAAVRGAFLVKDNIEEIMKACNVDEATAASLFFPMDFVLERQVRLPSGDWSAWSEVDRTVAEGILEEGDGFAEEQLPPGLIDPVFTMPLPALIMGGYGKLAMHPLVENYRLSDAQVKIQAELELAAMKKYAEIQPAQPAGPKRTPGGWSSYAFNQNQILSESLGVESPYSMRDNMMGNMPLPTGRPTRPGARQPEPMTGTQKVSDAAMKLMADRINKERDPVKQKKLREDFEALISANISAVGNVLLFRYLDFAVEPGKAYRYRARIVLANPNDGRRPADAEDSSVVEGAERKTDWSNISNVAEVERQTWYFVNQFDTRRDRVLFNFVHYDLNYGTDITNDYKLKDETTKRDRLAVAFGEPIGGEVTVPLLDPAKNTFEDTKYQFESGDLLVDGLEDIKLDKETHPDLKISVGSAKSLQLAEPVLIVKADGSLSTVDTFSQKPYVDYFAGKLKKNLEPWEFLRAASSLVGAGGGIDDVFGPIDTLDPMMSGMGDENGARTTTRRRSLSRKDLPPGALQGKTAGERLRARRALDGTGTGGDSPP